MGKTLEIISEDPTAFYNPNSQLAKDIIADLQEQGNNNVIGFFYMYIALLNFVIKLFYLNCRIIECLSRLDNMFFVSEYIEPLRAYDN